MCTEKHVLIKKSLQIMKHWFAYTNEKGQSIERKHWFSGKRKIIPGSWLVKKVMLVVFWEDLQVFISLKKLSALKVILIVNSLNMCVCVGLPAFARGLCRVFTRKWHNLLINHIIGYLKENAQMSFSFNSDICHCLPPDRTWYKVNDLKFDYSRGLEEGKVKHEPRLIDSDAARPPECGPAEAVGFTFVGQCPLASLFHSIQHDVKNETSVGTFTVAIVGNIA